MNKTQISLCQKLIETGNYLDTYASLEELKNYLVFLLKEASVKFEIGTSVGIPSAKERHSCTIINCTKGNHEFTIGILSNQFGDTITVVFFEKNKIAEDVFAIAAQIQPYR